MLSRLIVYSFIHSLLLSQSRTAFKQQQQQQSLIMNQQLQWSTIAILLFWLVVNNNSSSSSSNKFFCGAEVIHGRDLVERYNLLPPIVVSTGSSSPKEDGKFNNNNNNKNRATTGTAQGELLFEKKIPTIELPLIQGNYIEILISGNSYLMRLDFSLNDVYIFQEDEDAIYKNSNSLVCDKHTSVCTDVITLNNKVKTRQIVKIEMPEKYNEYYTRKIRFGYDGVIGLGPTSFIWSLWNCIVTLPKRIVFGPVEFIREMDNLTRFYDCTERSNLIVHPKGYRIDDICVMLDKTLEYTQVSETLTVQMGTLKQGSFVDIERNGDVVFGFSSNSLETKEYSGSVMRKVFEVNDDLEGDVIILGRTAMISSIAIHLPSGISYYSYYPKSIYNEIISGDSGLIMAFILVISVCYVFYTNYDHQLRHPSVFIKAHTLGFNVVMVVSVYFYIIVGVKPSMCSIKNYDRCIIVYLFHAILQLYYLGYIVWLCHQYMKISQTILEFPCTCNLSKEIIHKSQNKNFKRANKLQKSSFSVMPQVCSLLLSIWFIMNFIDDSNLFVVGIGVVALFIHNISVIYMIFHIVYCLKLRKQEITPSLAFWILSFICSLFILVSEMYDYLELLSPLSHTNVYTNVLFSITMNISMGFILSLKNLPNKIHRLINTQSQQQQQQRDSSSSSSLLL